jgi:hypothetical protein
MLFALLASWSVMISAILVAANMCLQGGVQIDISQYVASTANAVELKVTLTSAAGALVVYSPGYEAQQARFTTQNSFGVIPFAEPILCVKTIGGPFEFNIEVMPIEAME